MTVPSFLQTHIHIISPQVLAGVVEQEIVIRNLLGRFLPFVSYVVASTNSSKGISSLSADSLLSEASVLALCRCMVVSAAVCESSLPLLFTVLETSSSEPVRTTIMIALGDLAFRFPNAVEPWTDRMYAK